MLTMAYVFNELPLTNGIKLANSSLYEMLLSPRLGQLAIGLHWPIEHTMSSRMRLPCGPTWAARMAAPKMLILAHVFNELPLTDGLELANSGL